MTRELTTHSITDRARAFAVAFVNDPETAGNATASAVKAGYAERSAAQEGHRLLRHVGVRAEIERLTRQELGDHASAAVALLGRVVRDEKAPLKIRVDACKTILDRAGFIAPKAPDAPPPPLDPADINKMNLHQLLRMLAVQEAKVEAMERDMIDVTPTTETVDMEAATESDPAAAG
jgi:hypothetical protein